MSDEDACMNCTFPLSVEERFMLGLRVCKECAEVYDIDEWEAKR